MKPFAILLGFALGSMGCLTAAAMLGHGEELMEARDVMGWIVTIGVACVGWVITIAAAVAVYFAFQRHQIKIQRHQIKIARHAIVRQLEDDIKGILSAKSAQVRSRPSPDQPFGPFGPREFRFVLDESPPWIFEDDPDAYRISGWPQPVSETVDGQRHWLIRRTKDEGNIWEQEQFLASQAFQDVLLWFRRVNEAFKDDVVTPPDLANLGRYSLAFAASGRPGYFVRYFQGKDDIGAIVDVVNNTLVHLVARKWRVALATFRFYVTQEDLKILIRNLAEQRLHDGLDLMLGEGEPPGPPSQESGAENQLPK